MGKELGNKALQQVVNTVLNKSSILAELKTNYRKELNSKYHVLDLSYEALKSANLKSKAARKVAIFDRAYKQFIDAVRKHVNTQIYKTLDDITSISSKTFFVESPPLLISPSFEASRANITVISKSIKNNVYFGISDRTRTLAELLSEGYTLEELEAEGRIFDPKSGQELVLDPKTNKLIPRVRELSKVDLGHTPGTELGRDSPLSQQLLMAASSDNAALSASDFSNLNFETDLSKLDITQANETISGLLLNKLYDLSQVQANCTVSFKNEVPEKLASLTGGDAGFLTLTLQLYNVNNDISVKESAIRNSLISEIKEEIRKVIQVLPGSDTMEQDLANLVKQRIIDGISGRGSTAKLAPHSTLTANVVNDKKSGNKPLTESGSINVNNRGQTPPIRTLSGQFYSLAGLQQLLNDNLQNVIAANMGDGSSKNILNYRSGRFAASVQVERLSQSREGMITAFYSYMKNPYQTFEPGFRQGSPASRDPKLLIAKSIREIAETKVGNRMRAVSV